MPTSKDIIREFEQRLAILTTRCDLVMVESDLCRVKLLACKVSLLFEVDKICGQPCTPSLPLSPFIEPGSICPHPGGIGDECSVLIEFAKSLQRIQNWATTHSPS